MIGAILVAMLALPSCRRKFIVRRVVLRRTQRQWRWRFVQWGLLLGRLGE
jgi:hypothetical protein